MEIKKRKLIYKKVNNLRESTALGLGDMWAKALKKQVNTFNFVTKTLSEAPIKDAIQKAYILTMTRFANMTITRLRAKKADNFDPFMDSLIIDFVNKELGDRITAISETTRKEIVRLMQKALDEGINPIESSQAIINEMEGINKSRALTIARTETIAASNAGSHMGAESLNIPMVKTWQATFVNTRDPHSNASSNPGNQMIPLNQKYNVGGEALMYPGDLSGSPWNVINCRCVSIEEPKESILE